jgi:hypothetical protein
MGLFAKGVDVEAPLAAPKLVTQWRQTVGIYAPRAKEKPFRSLFKQESVSRLRAQCVEHARREGHLTL